MKDRVGIITLNGQALPVRPLTHEVMGRLFEIQEEALDPELPYTPARVTSSMKGVIRLACGLGWFKARRVFKGSSLEQMGAAYLKIMDLWNLGSSPDSRPDKVGGMAHV